MPSLRNPICQLFARVLIAALVVTSLPPLASPSYARTLLPGHIHADGIGSIRRLTDEAGLITDGYTYTAFGELIAHTGTDPQPYAFAGEPYDPNSGFQYHRARWMDPRVGRFLGMDRFKGQSSDPISLHRYLYADVDPVSRIDPTGLFSLPELTTVAKAISVLNTASVAWIVGTSAYRAGDIANDLLLEETIELEEAMDRSGKLGLDVATEILLYRFVNFEGLKWAASLARKFPNVLSRLRLGTRANVNGMLAEQYVGNTWGAWKNTGTWVRGHIPDFIDRYAIREVKNWKYLTWSSEVAPQLTAFATEAAVTGKRFYLHVRPSTRVSAKVLQELDDIFRSGAPGSGWELVRDVPDALRVVP